MRFIFINNFNITEIPQSVKSNAVQRCALCKKGVSSAPCTIINDKMVLVGCTISNSGWYAKRANRAHDLFKYIICVFQVVVT